MFDDNTKITSSHLGLLAFRFWVYLTRAPFDTAKRTRAAKQHPLQSRPKVRAFTQRLIRDAKALQIVKDQPTLPNTDSTGVPRLIWMYWDQGEAQAPDLVKFCIASWRQQNPDWAVHVLSAESAEVRDVFARLPETMLTAHRADVLRLALLDKHGGVWADASTFCATSLDQWLLKCLEVQGFFAFKFKPGMDRLLANWFLASIPGHDLTRSWLQNTLSYWSARSAADHYFIHHYLFDWMTLTDQQSRARWSTVPFLDAQKMHDLQHALRDMDTVRVETCLQKSAEYPVHKLDWRMSDALALISTKMAAGRTVPRQ